jgi:hypothetical protein
MYASHTWHCNKNIYLHLKNFFQNLVICVAIKNDSI